MENNSISEKWNGRWRRQRGCETSPKGIERIEYPWVGATTAIPGPFEKRSCGVSARKKARRWRSIFHRRRSGDNIAGRYSKSSVIGPVLRFFSILYVSTYISAHSACRAAALAFLTCFQVANRSRLLVPLEDCQIVVPTGIDLKNRRCTLPRSAPVALREFPLSFLFTLWLSRFHFAFVVSRVHLRTLFECRFRTFGNSLRFQIQLKPFWVNGQLL